MIRKKHFEGKTNSKFSKNTKSAGRYARKIRDNVADMEKA